MLNFSTHWPVLTLIALTLISHQALAEVQPAQRVNSENQRVRIAIIIDDLGYHLGRGQRAIDLPADITLSILPHAPNSKALAISAHNLGKEVMLHTPMSNTAGKPLDAGALTDTMSREQLVDTLRKNLAALPHVSGVNNHMGSLLTQQADPMHWLMSELIEQELFFIDSRTSANSLAFEIARDYALPTLKRDVFLDHLRDSAFITGQFDQLLRIAHKRGWALAIAHPYPETLTLLEKRLPQLAQEGVDVVYVSRLLQSQQMLAARTLGRTVDSAPATVPTSSYINPL